MTLAKPVALLIGAAALVLAPAIAPDLPSLGFKAEKAYANNGKGNGGGKGNSGGNSGNKGSKGNSGNSNRGGNSASNKSGGKGLGIFNRGGGNKQAKSNNGKGLGGFLNSVFGTESGTTKRKSASRGSGKSGKSGNYRLPKEERSTLASVAVTPSASPYGKPKNFNAKLGRLNSLKRNYHAYINSNDPHLAAIQEYINDTLAFERASEDLKLLEDDMIAAREALVGLLGDVDPYNEFSYDEATSEELKARLAELEEVDTTGFTQEEIDALEAERLALDDALKSDAYTSFEETETSYFGEKDKLDTLEDGISDEALKEALLSMANENRVREYGDDYVDEEMLDWAKQVLGVGEFDGKIDEIREATEEVSGEVEDGSDPLPDEAAASGDGSEPTEEDLRLSEVSQ